MTKTLSRAFGALGIAVALLCAAPTAFSASKKTPTPSAEKSAKVNLNTADEKDIAAAKGVGDKLAKELVANRPYKTWDEVSKVKGVGTGKKLDSLKKVLKLSDGSSGKEAAASTDDTSKKKKSKSAAKGEDTGGAAAGGSAAGAAAGGAAAGGGSGKSSSSTSSSKKSSSTSSESSASKLAPGEMININTASAEELDKLPEIGPVKAQAIVDYRNANGKFASIEDVMKVSGIKEGTFAKIKDHITVR
jgi:competence protein ComEA